MTNMGKWLIAWELGIFNVRLVYLNLKKKKKKERSLAITSLNIFLFNFNKSNIGLHFLPISFMLAKFQEDQRLIVILSIKYLSFKFS